MYIVRNIKKQILTSKDACYGVWIFISVEEVLFRVSWQNDRSPINHFSFDIWKETVERKHQFYPITQILYSLQCERQKTMRDRERNMNTWFLEHEIPSRLWQTEERFEARRIVRRNSLAYIFKASSHINSKMFKNSVRTSKKTSDFSITKINWAMLCKEKFLFTLRIMVIP